MFCRFGIFIDIFIPILFYNFSQEQKLLVNWFLKVSFIYKGNPITGEVHRAMWKALNLYKAKRIKSEYIDAGYQKYVTEKTLSRILTERKMSL